MVRSENDSRPPRPLSARRADPRKSTLLLVAFGLLGVAAALYGLFRVSDEQSRVAGTPASFDRGEIIGSADRRETDTLRIQVAPPMSTDDPYAGGRPERMQADQLTEAGRAVVLDSVRVASVVGNYTFWVVVGEDEFPVFLLGELTGRQAEGRVEIRRGQLVRIFGRVRQVRDFEWLTLDERERERLLGRETIVEATRVNILSDSAAN